MDVPSNQNKIMTCSFSSSFDLPTPLYRKGADTDVDKNSNLKSPPGEI